MRTDSILLLVLAATPLGTLPAQEAKACKLIPRAEAAQILGKPEVATAKVMDDDEKTCSYFDARFRLEVEAIPNVAQYSFGMKSMIRKKEAEAESGIGDEAMYTTHQGDPKIMARKGTHWVVVTLFYNWGGKPDQVRPTLQKLARAAVAKLH